MERGILIRFNTDMSGFLFGKQVSKLPDLFNGYDASFCGRVARIFEFRVSGFGLLPRFVIADEL
jgi:hypothetical protein